MLKAGGGLVAVEGLLFPVAVGWQPQVGARLPMRFCCLMVLCNNPTEPCSPPLRLGSTCPIAAAPFPYPLCSRLGMLCCAGEEEEWLWSTSRSPPAGIPIFSLWFWCRRRLEADQPAAPQDPSAQRTQQLSSPISAPSRLCGPSAFCALADLWPLFPAPFPRGLLYSLQYSHPSLTSSLPSSLSHP